MVVALSQLLVQHAKQLQRRGLFGITGRTYVLMDGVMLVQHQWWVSLPYSPAVDMVVHSLKLESAEVAACRSICCPGPWRDSIGYCPSMAALDLWAGRMRLQLRHPARIAWAQDALCLNKLLDTCS